MTKPSEYTGGYVLTNNPDFVEDIMRQYTMVIFPEKQYAFAQVTTSGSIDELIETLRHDFGFSVPAADLLSSDPYAAMTSNITDSKDLGSGVINGRECDHLAFRTE